jgi:hypothetical protein
MSGSSPAHTHQNARVRVAGDFRGRHRAARSCPYEALATQGHTRPPVGFTSCPDAGSAGESGASTPAPAQRRQDRRQAPQRPARRAARRARPAANSRAHSGLRSPRPSRVLPSTGSDSPSAAARSPLSAARSRTAWPLPGPPRLMPGHRHPDRGSPGPPLGARHLRRPRRRPARPGQRRGLAIGTRPRRHQNRQFPPDPGSPPDGRRRAPHRQAAASRRPARGRRPGQRAGSRLRHQVRRRA